MKKTGRIAIIAVFTALYFVLSTMLKIPVGGHITLDLGYIALTVGAVYLGAVPTTLIGALGALLESMVMSQRGISPGWILMNAIVGFTSGSVMHRYVDGDRRQFVRKSVAAVLGSMLVGVTVKTLIDCALYQLPLAAKIPTGIVAMVTDSIVMLAFGLPLSLALRKRVHSIGEF